VLAFTCFALLARKTIAVFGINPDSIKEVSLALLLLFGLVMLSETLSRKFSALTSGLAEVGNKSPIQGEGLVSGMAIGALIGLVWTPCAGPILAAVLVQIIRQETDSAGIAVLLAFALGTATPMLVIALMGRKIIGRIGFLIRHAETMRKIFGVLILFSAGILAFNVDIGAFFTKRAAVPAHINTGLEDALTVPYAAPEIIGIADWLNSPPVSIHDLKGKVILVDFWTYSCINCVRTLPILTAWDAKYRDQGLVIIGIHSPEFEFEKNPDNVKAAIAQYNIHYPVALDNYLAIWASFNNRYWPAHYLIDKTGHVVYTHFGEGKYDVTENNIRYLLGLRDAKTAAAKPVSGSAQTPETYLGYTRAQRFLGTLMQDQPYDYRFPESLPPDSWALSGKWHVGAENITTAEKGAKLRLNFTAGKVFLVLGNADNIPVHAEVTLDGKPAGTVTVDHHDLYKIITQDTARRGLLEITCDKAALQAYAFTFGE